jgi:amino acid adenylation domain-containing protein
LGSSNDVQASVEALSPVKRALLDRRRAASSRAERGVDAVERPPGGAALSFAQQRLWLLDQLTPGSTAYNVVRAVRLNGRLDVAALSGAVDVVVARHEVLRSRIVAVDGEPRIQIDPPRSGTLTIEDMPPLDATAAVRETLRAEADRHLDLSSEHPFRARLLRLGDEDWLLVLATHHVASDGASRSILYDELSATYEALHAGQSPELPELPVQYADWAAWQRDQLLGSALRLELDWWRQYLDGAPATLALPAGRPGSSQWAATGSRFLDLLEPEHSAGLHALARRHGVTLFTTLLAGLAALLGRYGNDDVVVGFPVSGRARPEIEGLVGYFSNTVVARVGTDGEPSFSELVDRARVAMLGALSHAEVPFERLVEELAPDRRNGANPLFQLALSVESGADSRPRLPGLTATPIEMGPTQSKFELALVVAPLADGALQLEWEYDNRRFDAGTVARISGHLRALLTGAARDPSAPVSAIDVLSTAERDELARWGSRSDGHAGPTPTLPERFAANVATYPDRIAARDSHRSLTYAELDAASDRVAVRLRQLGTGPGALVGVCLGRSVDLVVGQLGVLKTGAAYVPLDPQFPAERISLVLADAHCLALVTTGDLLGNLPSDGPPAVRLDDPTPPVDREELPPPTGAPQGTDLAYAIYTSGSTGTPKGVMIEHGALANVLRSMAREPGLGPSDVLVAVTTPAFDIAALELFLPLWVGAQVVVASHADTVDPDRLAALVERAGATVLQATPATWSALVGTGWSGRAGLRAWCGGEALPAPLAAQLLRRCAEVWNLYGPTETTIWSLVARLEAPLERVPIGRPVDATEVLVVDGHDQLAPIGVPGELLIGGTGLARGYLGQPELTAQRFVPAPLAGGRRVYRTGDLVRWEPGGRLEFLGRLDHQVKLRGFRIEPAEVEAALLAQPGVAAAVVVLREDTPGDPRLVGYVTGDGSLDPGKLRRSVGSRLPAYLVPAAVVRLPALPRTPNGKLDRSRLPAPDAGRDRTSRPVAPGTPVERALAEIWADVLGVSTIGRDDDFFDLGGHSLLIVSLAARVRREFGIDLPVQDAYATSTLAGMATVVSAQLLASPAADDLEQLLEELEGLPR